ncbi:uncharacterized protein LOC130719163 [Lotus japonicus]|uniref:uncharacterized protein LOC130719163 n=1 Tax=Lotus japonicus TaxID=34305 RepID=UPI00258B5B83|nr:uncharacterized protein LOC130719163 [Lotus japonicus]
MVQGQGNLDDRMGWMSARWEAPPRGCIKINCDGSYSEQQQVMGARGVFRDEKGSWLLGYRNASQGGNAFEAEAMLLICEVDCRDLLDAIQRKDVARFVPTVQHIRNLLGRTWQVSTTKKNTN